MIGLLAKGAKAIAGGRAQAHFGMQSPQLAGGLVRVGRFLYVTTGAWISVVWYSAYVNMRTEPGSGPRLVLPGKPIIGAPDRPSRTPSFAVNLFSLLTGSASSPTSSSPIDAAAGAVGTAIIGQAGSIPNARAAYPAGGNARTDQGVDFTNPGAVRAILPGKVIYAGLWHGWPGTDGIVYMTNRGPVYVMEHFARALNPQTGKPFAVGDTITQGQVLGVALRGYPWIETGFANEQGTGPATPYNGRPDGTPMPGGLAFRKLLGM